MIKTALHRGTNWLVAEPVVDMRMTGFRPCLATDQAGTRPQGPGMSSSTDAAPR